MRTDLDHLPAHKQRERDISPNYGKSAAKSIDGALQTWCNQAAADGCLVPEFSEIRSLEGELGAYDGHMVPKQLAPGIGPVLMAIWRVRSCRLRLGNMRSGIPSLPGLV
jgi:hypothetical protein